MMTMQSAVRAVLMSGLLVVPMATPAQTKTPAKPNTQSVTAANSADANRVSRETLTSTVHEAWLASGRNEDKFFDMVKECAQMSAQKRGLTLPDTEAAGRRMGTLIRTIARRDPDQLLYAVVDAAVKQTGIPPTQAAK
jgi:hypothetical protein